MNERIQDIYLLLENRAINAALMNIESIAREINEGDIGDEAHQLLVSHNMMISYAMKGIKDPNMNNMITKTVAHAYNIIDRIAEISKINKYDSYTSKLHKSIKSENITLEEVQNRLEKYTENISTANLMYSADELNAKKIEIAKDHEEAVNYMFNKIFVSLKWNETEYTQAQDILNSILIADEDKAVLLSAVTMSLLHMFDDKKFMTLLSSYNNSNPLISTRALVGIVLILETESERIKLYPEIVAQISILKDDKRVIKDIRNIQLQLLMARETSNVDKKMREEIIPEMMRSSDSITLRNIVHDTDEKEAENPDWEKAAYDSGFSDKIKEMNDLQSSGADIYMSTFSMLKNYTFFFKMSHWFYPFYQLQNDVLPIIDNMKKDNIPFFDVVLKSVFFCNSDKYSLCFTFQNIPSSQKDMFVSQFSGMGGGDVDKDELLKTFNEESKNSDVISRQYIQDLYRFFKLWHYKSEEKDIFLNGFNLWNNPFLSDILKDKNTLKQIGAFLFKFDHLNEAFDVYKIIIDENPNDTEAWQKSGFILQKLAKYEEAINYYLRADMLTSDQQWTIHHLAKCYKKLKDYHKAIEYYKKIEEIRPDDLSITNQIGQCFIKLENYKEAQKYFFKMIYLDEKSVQAQRALGWCMLNTGNLDEAKKYFSLVVQEFSDNAFDYLYLGHISLIQGNVLEAINNYRIAAAQFIDRKDLFEAIKESKQFLSSHGVSDDYVSILTDLIL